MSDIASVPTSVASISSRLARLHTMRVALPATWWLVTTYPSRLMIAPLPAACSLCIRPALGRATTT